MSVVGAERLGPGGHVTPVLRGSHERLPSSRLPVRPPQTSRGTGDLEKALQKGAQQNACLPGPPPRRWAGVSASQVTEPGRDYSRTWLTQGQDDLLYALRSTPLCPAVQTSSSAEPAGGRTEAVPGELRADARISRRSKANRPKPPGFRLLLYFVKE